MCRSHTSPRTERQLRQVFEQRYAGNKAKAAAMVQEVEQLGLEPFESPAPLPPITLTIAANSFRVADHLVKRMKKGG